MAGLETLGERKLIERILTHTEKMTEMPVPFGDDVAAYCVDRTRLAVLKIDMLVGSTDIPPTMSLEQAARKAVVMNVSDFAAKGVKPLTVLVALGLSAKMTVQDIDEIGRGLDAGAREYGAYIVGGDTGEAADFVVGVSLFGLAEKDKLMLRSGARLGDVVAVTGSFGKTAAGLRILMGKAKAPKRIQNQLIDPVLMPHARLSEGIALAESGAVTAAIDSSDGLAWSLHEIAVASRVGLLIDTLPLAGEVEEFAKSNITDVSELVLYGGEEYELVLTISSRLWKRAQEAIREVGGELWRIGEVVAGNRITLEMNGERREIEARGYEHFRRSRS